MALVKIPAEGRTVEGESNVREYLSGAGIDYQVVPTIPLSSSAPGVRRGARSAEGSRRLHDG